MAWFVIAIFHGFRIRPLCTRPCSQFLLTSPAPLTQKKCRFAEMTNIKPTTLILNLVIVEIKVSEKMDIGVQLASLSPLSICLDSYSYESSRWVMAKDRWVVQTTRSPELYLWSILSPACAPWICPISETRANYSAKPSDSWVAETNSGDNSPPTSSTQICISWVIAESPLRKTSSTISATSKTLYYLPLSMMPNRNRSIMLILASKVAVMTMPLNSTTTRSEAAVLKWATRSQPTSLEPRLKTRQ